MLYDFEARLARPTALKIADLERNGRLKHVIFSRQFNRELIDHLCGIASMIQDLAQIPEGREFLGGRLAHLRAMLYFTQPSTRTFLSFMAACQMLGLTCNEIRDPSVSSEYKGESKFDSVRMFSSYFDLIIMRTREPRLAECCAYLMNDLDDFNQRSVPVVNGGSGADEHPTQALLDVYTAQRCFEFTSERDAPRRISFEALRARNPTLKKGLPGKTYCFCGDIGRGRTIRSFVNLLSLYSGVRMIFVSPEHERLRLPEELRARLLQSGVEVQESRDLDKVIEEVDLLYMTRIQHEWDTGDDKTSLKGADLSRYWLTQKLVSRMKEHAVILHPFPRNEEIAVEIDTDPRALYFTQARNGMWIRAALIAYLFDVDGAIMRTHPKLFAERHDYNLGNI
jgi:aspartate carbamoyltransferase catalytic subunit